MLITCNGSQYLSSTGSVSLVKVKVLVAQLCLTLCDHLVCPWDSPGKNTGVGCHSFFRDLPDLGVEPATPMSPALAEGFFTTSATWEGHVCFEICPSNLLLTGLDHKFHVGIGGVFGLL